MMLMITEKRNTHALTFNLAGTLAGNWATEFKHCWRNARSSSKDIRIIVDLREGAELIARDILMKSIVEEIANESSIA